MTRPRRRIDAQSPADPLQGVLTPGSPESRSDSRGDSSERHPKASTPPPRATCGGCDSTWTGTAACHCSGCHRTFSGVGLFDKHRSAVGEYGACIDPATITDKHDQPVTFFRDGMWRGPELTEEQITKAWGGGRP